MIFFELLNIHPNNEKKHFYRNSILSPTVPVDYLFIYLFITLYRVLILTLYNFRNILTTFVILLIKGTNIFQLKIKPAVLKNVIHYHINLFRFIKQSFGSVNTSKTIPIFSEKVRMVSLEIIFLRAMVNRFQVKNTTSAISFTRHCILSNRKVSPIFMIIVLSVSDIFHFLVN